MSDILHYSPSVCVTHRCNLNCVYCYQKHENVSMSFDTAKNVIEKIFNSVPKECRDIHISFIGGEPLLEFDLIKDICEYTWKSKRNIPYIFFASTNGSVLTDEMKAWFVKNKRKFKLGLSLDGKRELHNKNRSNSFDSIDIPFFQKNYPDEGIKMTLSEHSIPQLAENIQFLHSLNLDMQGTNLAEGNFNWDDDKFIFQLSSELQKLVDFYIENPKLKVCQMFDKNLALCEQKKPSKIKYCGIGYGADFFDVDGKRYPCPFCTPMTFSQVELEKMAKTEFDKDENFVDEDCYNNCYLYPICPSCAGNNFMHSGCFNKHERVKCKITKFTALFIAELQAKKIVNGTDGFDKERRYWTIEAIKKIKSLYFDDFRQYLG